MLNSILLQITSSAAAADTNKVTDSLQQATAMMAQAAAPAAPTEDSIQLLELLIKGGPIMLPIAFLSVLTLYFFFERLLAIRKAAKTEATFMNTIKDFIHNGNIEAAKTFCRSSATPMGRMIEKGVSRIGKPIKEIEGAIESVGKIEIANLEKNLNVLSIIGRIAPILGFIGTIMGVIVIFYDIGISGDIAIKTISKGLYQKMITSASGLVIGLFAYLSYFVINNMIDRLVLKLDTATVEFIDILQQPGK